MNKVEKFLRIDSDSRGIEVKGRRLYASSLLVLSLVCASVSSPVLAQAGQAQPPAGTDQGGPAITGAIRTRDVIGVQIQGEASLTGQYPVNADGTITMPLVGNVKVAGMTATRAATAIADVYKKKNLLRSPQVLVAIIGRPVRSVLLSGALDKQGRMALTDDTRLGEVLEPSGITPTADLSKVVITRGEKQIVVNYLAFRTGADAPEGPNNPLLEDGDKIYVRARVQVAGTIKVNGEVKTPQVANLVDTSTAFQAIQLAGGVTELADRSRIFILRDGMEIPIPYKAIQEGAKEKDVLLKDKDEIFVRRAGSVKINGEVKTPQLLNLTDAFTVLQAIQFSGGVTDLGDRNKVVVMRDGKEIAVPYKEIQEGAKEKDLVLKDKDEIFVRKLEKPKVFTVNGGVPRSGPVALVGETITLNEAIAAAGGPLNRVDTKKITVQRKLAAGGIETKTYNLTVASDQATPIQAEDIITVPYPKTPKQNPLTYIGSVMSLLVLFRR
ncbi:MAG: SLBB domain-containing protein [Armatimonas sp.]